MKKFLFFFMVTAPLFTLCMKGPLRKAHSDSSLLTIRNWPKKQSFVPLSPKYKVLQKKLLQKKPGLAFVLLVRGKKLRLDPDVNKQANELNLIAQRVNPFKRNLDAFDFMAKIIRKKNREKSSRVEAKGMSSRKAKDNNSSKGLSI